jgi:hypothetical protein
MTNQRSTSEQDAHDLGAMHARNAASWVVDGNSDVRMARKLLQMMREGDPAADDYFPARPNLSGEWADSLTPRALCEAIGVETDDGDEISALCDAYEAGVDESFEDAIEQELRTFVEDES